MWPKGLELRDNNKGGKANEWNKTTVVEAFSNEPSTGRTPRQDGESNESQRRSGSAVADRCCASSESDGTWSVL